MSMRCVVWGPKARGAILEHVLISAGGKLAWPISTDVKEVDRHREGQAKMAESSTRKPSLSFAFIAPSPN